MRACDEFINQCGVDYIYTKALLLQGTHNLNVVTFFHDSLLIPLCRGFQVIFRESKTIVLSILAWTREHSRVSYR